MKHIYLAGVFTLGILLAGCFSDDGISNRYVNLQITDALVFENDQVYSVGDTIYIDLNFNRYLDEAGFSNKLDIYESSGSDSFQYEISLEKFSELSNGFRAIVVSPEFLFAEKGTIDEFGRTLAQLNNDTSQYESRVGLILREAGRFNFDFRFLYIESSDYFEDKVQIYIEHNFSNSDGIFEFTVNE